MLEAQAQALLYRKNKVTKNRIANAGDAIIITIQNAYWTMPKLDNFKPCAEQLASILAQYNDLLESSTFFTYSYLPAVTFTFCFHYKKSVMRHYVMSYSV